MYAGHFLTTDQKQPSTYDLKHRLELFQRNLRELIRRYVTMDKTTYQGKVNNLRND